MTEPPRDMQDLIQLGVPHPAEAGLPLADREHATQRFANRCFRGGIAIVISGFVGILVAWLRIGGHLDAHPQDRMLVELLLLGTVGIGSAFVGVGGVDRLYRPQRAISRQLFLEVRRNEQRMNRIEAAIERIAEVLPDELHRRDWHGFTRAVERGFIEDTGTDGRDTTSRHLGIVRATKTGDS